MNEPGANTAIQLTTTCGPTDYGTAFLEVIERSRTSLIRLAYRTTRNLEEAEDVVQEAIMKGWVCLHQFRGQSRLETWLRVIVINTARNWLRRRRGYTLLPMEQSRPGEEETVLQEIADTRRNPEQWLEYNELEARIAAAVEGLHSRYQGPIRMCLLGESSYLEASSALNLNLVTVRARIFRGRELLRRHLRRTLREKRAKTAQGAN